MATTSRAIRGTFLDFVDDPWRYPDRETSAVRFVRDGLLVFDDGLIVDFGDHASVVRRRPNLKILDRSGRLILPGFVDGHIHFPQTRIPGAFGHQLLDWFLAWVVPEELKYRDRVYAREAARRFFDHLLAAGTTTAQVFTTSSPVSTEELFDEAARRNLRIIAGLTGIDRFAPAEFLDTPDNFYRDAKALVERYHRCGRALYAITPRFALGCSPEMLGRCRQLKDEHPDCWINTHISEHPAEVRAVRDAFPDCRDYTHVYERFGLLGPKFSAGHGVWLSDDEFRRFANAGAAVVFCPTSNLFLGSGLFRLGRATDPAHRVRVAFGTDIGGGNSFSMLRVLDEAYKVGMCNFTLLDGSVDPRRRDLDEAERGRLSPFRAFWSITLGGAKALYLDEVIGNFDLGKEADFVVLDWNAGPPAMAWRQSLAVPDGRPADLDQAARILFGLMALGDERNVVETWAAGRLVHSRATTPSSSTEITPDA